MNHPASTRRGFFSALSAAALAQQVAAATQSASATGMPTRPLGRTGVQVSVLGLGGHHAARPKEESESFRLIHTASMKASRSWTTPGSTTTGARKRSWAKPSPWTANAKSLS
jgi:hypothetical protein